MSSLCTFVPVKLLGAANLKTKLWKKPEGRSNSVLGISQHPVLGRVSTALPSSGPKDEIWIIPHALVHFTLIF